MAAPTSDIGRPDFNWGTWGQGLLSEWWETSPELIWPQSVITFGRMRIDPKLAAVLSAYCLPLMRATWVVDPDGCRDEVVQRVADNLGVAIMGNEDEGPGPARRRGVIWGQHLEKALNFLTYGHFPFERRYAVQPDGFLALDNLGERPPWTIALMNIGNDGLLKSIEQTTQNEPVPASRLVWYGNKMIGSNYAGLSLLRPSYGAWLFKHEGWRVHGTSIRRFGMGVPVIEAPSGASATQVAQAQALASSMRAGDQSGMGMPQGFKASLMGMTGGSPDALGWIKYLDDTMAGSALAGLLQLGQTETGSRALGESFLDLFLLSLQAVADNIALTATSGRPEVPGIITDLVDQNWGTPDNPEPAPRLVCTDVGESYDVNAAAIQSLVACGALTPDAALDAWVRKLWRMPKRTTPWTPSSRGLPAGDAISPPVENALRGTPSDPHPDAQTNPSAVPAKPEPAAPKARRKVSAKRLPWYVAASSWEPDRHQEEWEQALASLLVKYRAVWSTMRTDLVDQVIAALQSGTSAALSLVPPASATGIQLVQEAMQATALHAAQQMISEAAAQGVAISLDAVRLDVAQLSGIASARAGVAASYMAQQASSKALQVFDPTPSGFLAAGDEVDKFLSGLSDKTLRDQLGGALTAAQNHGRYAVLEAAPEDSENTTYVAAEFLDVNTCENCRKEDGTEFGSLAAAEAAYPTGGFKDCLGLMRCRGTIVTVWGDS